MCLACNLEENVTGNYVVLPQHFLLAQSTTNNNLCVTVCNAHMTFVVNLLNFVRLVIISCLAYSGLTKNTFSVWVLTSSQVVMTHSFFAYLLTLSVWTKHGSLSLSLSLSLSGVCVCPCMCLTVKYLFFPCAWVQFTFLSTIMRETISLWHRQYLLPHDNGVGLPQGPLRFLSTGAEMIVGQICVNKQMQTQRNK